MTGLWICVGMQLWKGSESGFRVFQGSAYASVERGSEYAWIWLNNFQWQSSEYA